MAKGSSTSRTNPEGGAPLTIDKLTQGYDPTEDRMRIDAQQNGGRMIRLWLTRRLADVMFGHLANRLRAPDTGKDPAFTQFMQVCEQQAAQAQVRGDQPVQWQGEAVLVTAVEIGRAKAGTRVVFKAKLAGVDHPVAQFTVSPTHLRQWLGLIYRIYAAARWPLDVWPEWISKAQRIADATHEAQESP